MKAKSILCAEISVKVQVYFRPPIAEIIMSAHIIFIHIYAGLLLVMATLATGGWHVAHVAAKYTSPRSILYPKVICGVSEVRWADADVPITT